jgi:hypothetical protein
MTRLSDELRQAIPAIHDVTFELAGDRPAPAPSAAALSAAS